MEYLVIVLLIGLIMSLIYFDNILYAYEIVKLHLQIFYQTIVLMIETGYTIFEHEVICKKIDKAVIEGLNECKLESYIFDVDKIKSLYQTETNSIERYAETCTIQNLIPEEKSDWKQEMIDDLSFYCPMVIIGRIINRIEEIIDNKN